MLAEIVNNIEKLQKYEGRYTITRDAFQFTLPKTEELFDLRNMRYEEKAELENVVDALLVRYKNEISKKHRDIYHIQLNDSLGKAYLINTRRHINSKDMIEKFDTKIKAQSDLFNKVKGENGDLQQLEALSDARNDLLDEIDTLKNAVAFCEKVEADVLMIVQKIIVEALTYGKGDA